MDKGADAITAVYRSKPGSSGTGGYVLAVVVQLKTVRQAERIVRNVGSFSSRCRVPHGAEHMTVRPIPHLSHLGDDAAGFVARGTDHAGAEFVDYVVARSGNRVALTYVKGTDHDADPRAAVKLARIQARLLR